MDKIVLQDDTVHLNNLSIVRTLGKGMFGMVFLAAHDTKEVLYALKTVNRSKITAYKL